MSCSLPGCGAALDALGRILEDAAALEVLAHRLESHIVAVVLHVLQPLTLSLLYWLRLPSVDGHSLITSDSWAPGTSFAETHASINVMHTNLWGISTRQSTASGRDAHVDSEARRFPQRCNFPRSS